MTDKLYTMQDLCELLQVSRSTVNRIISSGELPVVRIGGSVRFSPAAVDRYIRSNETRSAAPRRKTDVKAPAPFRYVPGMKVV